MVYNKCCFRNKKQRIGESESNPQRPATNHEREQRNCERKCERNFNATASIKQTIKDTFNKQSGKKSANESE